MDETISNNVELSNHTGDGGACGVVTCPKCGDHIHTMEHPWIKSRCRCGLEWCIVITGVGA